MPTDSLSLTRQFSIVVYNIGLVISPNRPLTRMPFSDNTWQNPAVGDVDKFHLKGDNPVSETPDSDHILRHYACKELHSLYFVCSKRNTDLQHEVSHIYRIL